MPALFEFLHTVAESEIDQLGHANNLVYLKWMQSAALAHSAAQGWPSARYKELGAGWVVRSHQIKYLQSAFVDQEIVVRTWVADMNRVSSRRRFKIMLRADETLLASAETQWAFVNYATGTLAPWHACRARFPTRLRSCSRQISPRNWSPPIRPPKTGPTEIRRAIRLPAVTIVSRFMRPVRPIYLPSVCKEPVTDADWCD